MSSKAVGQQQQGRRTPLSLTGGKNNHHQQQQQNMNKAIQNSNNNSTKNQESKDSTTSTKNNNQVAKNQQESRDSKDTKKTQQQQQQNGNDCVNILEQNGATNGTNNSNGVPNKSNGNSGKTTNQNVVKDNREKEKGNDKETETVKDKSDQKTKKGDASKVNEKKQNEANEKQTPNQQSPSSTTSISNSADNNDKKRNSHNATPSKLNTSGSGSQKSSTPSKAEKTEKSAPPTPQTKSSTASKTTTPSKSPKSNAVAEKFAEVIELDDDDMDDEPLIIESSPSKKLVTGNAITPAATSTPGNKLARGGKRGKDAGKSDDQITTDPSIVPRSYSDISGRRSIRSIGDYTPSKYNAQFRESYRRINTELDVTGNTNNTSMNVTVGSEIPNNSSFLSFSFFGRGRKRERTPPSTNMPGKSQSAVELTSETTPPKRARLDVNGLFSAMSSPLTLLRTRFSKTTLETPLKEKQLTTTTDDVQNVSGVSIEEVENTATEDITVGQEAIAEKTPSKNTTSKDKEVSDGEKSLQVDDAKTAPMDVDGDIKITETPIVGAVGEPKIKQKGCTIM